MSKIKLLAGLAISTLLLSSCGYSGQFRYPCQDPTNWESDECNPPICEVDGACTEALIGFDPSGISDTTAETVPTEETVAP